MPKSTFTQYCEDIVLPAYLVLKPGGDHKRTEVYEALQLFDTDNVFTTVYANEIRALESSIRIMETPNLYKNRRILLVTCLETELNNHNRYFPDNKINNPFNHHVKGES